MACILFVLLVLILISIVLLLYPLNYFHYSDISLWLGKYRYFPVVWKYHYYYMNKAFHLMASQDTNTAERLCSCNNSDISKPQGNIDISLTTGKYHYNENSSGGTVEAQLKLK